MNPQRPFFLNLLVIRLPIGGVVSILHRASGVLLSLAVPLLLYTLMLSLRGPADFDRVRAFFTGLPGWLLGTLAAWALLHHFLAGLRHLGFDLGLGEDKATARATAWASLGGAVLVIGILALLMALGGMA